MPTLAEMARIKAWLLATRHTVRDYLDTVVLLERLGEAGALEAFARFDEFYRQETGASPLVEVIERLVGGHAFGRTRRSTCAPTRVSSPPGTTGHTSRPGGGTGPASSRRRSWAEEAR